MRVVQIRVWERVKFELLQHLAGFDEPTLDNKGVFEVFVAVDC